MKTHINNPQWSCQNDKPHPEHNKHSFKFYSDEDGILPFSNYISCFGLDRGAGLRAAPLMNRLIITFVGVEHADWWRRRCSAGFGLNKWVFSCVGAAKSTSREANEAPEEWTLSGDQGQRWLEAHLQGCWERQRLRCFCGKDNQ